ncbi:hypothetical protein E3T43_07300 [Cryobacterium sp. Hh7]|uniref:hypothetical protein n=1 Tax=Cryobacterium sp. Hh7 TaxID=1259159 RepID=UPI00106D170E|nr:hypothetical protein [Cryobacterium sp. Hh7]TFD58045.1 hypothetical protein E3T43_07300 [Cryobacterium sp. Hh7]
MSTHLPPRQLDLLEQAVIDAARNAAARPGPIPMADLKDAVASLDRQRAYIEEAKQFSQDLPSSEVITGARATGKTTAAAEWVKDGRRYLQPDGRMVNDRVLCTLDMHMAEEHMLNHGLTKTEVTSYRVLREQRGGPRGEGAKQYALDESNHVLAQLLNLRSLPALMIVLTP